MEPVVYNVQEVAELLKVSKDTVYEMIRQKRLKCIRMGKAIRVPRKYIDEFIENELE